MRGHAGGPPLEATSEQQDARMQNHSQWNDVTIAELRKLWDEGHSTAEIGRCLNVSKNAVVGKAHRLNLTTRKSPIKTSPQRQDCRPSPSRPSSLRATLPMRPFSQRALAGRTIVAELESPACAAPNAAATLGATQDRQPLSGVRQCCWPIGDPGTPNFRFCDVPFLPGKPYCEAHARLAYVRTPSRSEVAVATS
jgi:GcrA cell cycle regulator